MIVVPRRAGRRRANLRVRASVEQKGSCMDMYFTMINVTGTWAFSQHGKSGKRYSARMPGRKRSTGWKKYGAVSLKVVWGHTPQGVRYLNLFAKNLKNLRFDVGGLLGEDDHAAAATPKPGCRTMMAL
ncbi:unnamed protein product [Prorocentrum cordatum]|uniref:Uncharacterized protein n=1 Tax=Prorocentrum cordatum TaxID=2364126 RepID=A0ABN9WWB1_9DINO|nr:unnamed protein product [Polarella glacialis]